MTVRTAAGAGADDDSTVIAWRPRVSREPVPIDLAAAEKAAADLLVALGQPIDSAGMSDTPRRMANAYRELLTADDFELTTFPNSDGYDEVVVVQDIPVRSVCEHHLLPFTGVAQVGYLPGDRILGLSKFARVVDFLGRRAQTQEGLTRRIADYLQTHLAPAGVGVVVEAEHTCMTLRGVRAGGTRTVTAAFLGVLRDDRTRRGDFVASTRNRLERS